MIGDRPGVLLVDDRPENLLALRAVLEPLQCRCTSVTSGEDALKALLQEDFAVVLLDVQMPGMDGFETAELIKQRERTRAVPIIFVTAISKERDHVFRGYSAGAVDYLFKPYDPGVLRSKVRVFLDLDAKSRAAAESEALLRAAFASAPIGMARLDLEGRCAEVNRAFGDLLGYEPAELNDRLLETLAEPARGEGDWRARLGEGRVPTDPAEVRMIPKSGEPIPAILTFAKAQPGGSLPDAVVVGVQDLRERRLAEREREQRIREQVARTEAERLTAHHRALQSISDAAMGTVGFDELVGELLKRTAASLAVDTAAFVLDDTDGRSTVHQVVSTVDAGGLADQRWYSVVTGDAASLGRSPVGDRMTSTLTVPLAVEGDLIGALHVGTLFERKFTVAEEGLLRLAADRAALGIRRARLYQREHAIAEELQRSLLPAQLPEIPGVAAAARYFAAEAGAQVGGDWYDALIQPDGRLLLIIGDVAGRGIKAASTMGQLRSALRAYALDGHSPAGVLDRLNTFQAAQQGRDFATVGLVSVAPEDEQLHFACAGHPPALLIGPDGKAQWLRGALGPPLGAVEDATYSEKRAALPPGSTLVLYTDGLVEKRTEPLDQGLGRLEAAAVGAPEGVDALCETIIDQTVGDRLTDDDVTLLVLRTAGDRAVVPAAEPPPFEGIRRGISARQLGGSTWPYHATRSARVELPGGPRAGEAARQAVQETFAGAASEQELSDLRSVVAEVVNNAVVHGGAKARDQTVVVHLAAAETVVRVEVCSDGEAFEPKPPPPREEPGGFGLVILDTLTSRWGLDHDGDVCVWFEIDRAAAAGLHSQPADRYRRARKPQKEK